MARARPDNSTFKAIANASITGLQPRYLDVQSHCECFDYGPNRDIWTFKAIANASITGPTAISGRSKPLRMLRIGGGTPSEPIPIPARMEPRLLRPARMPSDPGRSARPEDLSQIPIEGPEKRGPEVGRIQDDNGERPLRPCGSLTSREMVGCGMGLPTLVWNDAPSCSPATPGRVGWGGRGAGQPCAGHHEFESDQRKLRRAARFTFG